MSEARQPCHVEDVHELGHPCRCAHLNCQVEGANRPSAHAGDPAVSSVRADKGLQLLVREAAGLRQSVKTRLDDVDAVQQGSHVHAAFAPQCQQNVCDGLPCCRQAFPAAARPFRLPQ
eukprot:359593-Chlamydomonas_euryale.AAC.3